VERQLHLLLEFPTQKPLKLKDKLVVLNEITNICKLSGARDISVTDSYYVSGKSPERPQTFELLLSITATIQSVVTICDAIQNTYAYPDLGLYPKISLKRGTRPFIDITNDKDAKDIIDKLDKESKNQILKDKDEVIVDVQMVNDYDKESK